MPKDTHRHQSPSTGSTWPLGNKKKSNSLNADRLKPNAIQTTVSKASIVDKPNAPVPVRTVAHIEGNWATYIYIPNSNDSLGLHVSLCQTAYLKVFQIDRFMALLEQQIGLQSRFTVSFNGVSSYVNDEQTRSFVGMDIGHGHEELLELVQCVDLALTAFHQPPFYKVLNDISVKCVM
ncbi:hypothetical protein BDEG_26013 [Batrachochytrium dendrobatidis JEL423]|uniref:U6 snRNA phosphodiesterase 1 n=1 Tax=Batrachochytrium dendrobatidis (strain JEL423) TaxID=403673 RepID=A0A177WSC6_BATDL|nr:hypothetical protein BDEG_26013 [Batrachochytrium dendrobatidis JEL423]